LNPCAFCSKTYSRALRGCSKLHSYSSDLVLPDAAS
jgi:hypothetical protein